MMELPARKRNRISLSCTYCKKRKVKCDRGRPCASCNKYNVPHLCEYPGFDDLPSFEDQDIKTSSNRPRFMVKGFVTPNTGTTESLDHGGSGSNSLGVAGNTVNGLGVMNGSNGITHINDVNKSHNGTGGTNGSNRSSSSGSNSSSKKKNSEAMASELEALKGKIKQLESSLHSEESPMAPEDTIRFNSKPGGYTGLLKAHTSGYGASPAGNIKDNGLSNYTVANLLTNKDTGSTPNSNATGFTPLLPQSGLSWSPLSVADTPQAISGSQGDPNMEFSLRARARYMCNNFYSDPNEVVSFYEAHNSMFSKDKNNRQNFGIFTWLAFVSRDKGLRLIWESLQNNDSTTMPLQLPQEVMSAETPVHDGQQAEFKKRATVLETHRYLKDINSNEEPEADTRTSENMGPIKFVDSETTNFNERSEGYCMGLVVEVPLNQDLELAEKIVKVLPKKKVIWLLVNKFFTHVYPFMPFIDENSFKSEISRIIGPQDMIMEPVLKLNVEKRLDYAYLGLLLLMLRFAFLSSFSNIKEVNEANVTTEDTSIDALDLKLLLSTPISIQLITMAQQCVDQFNVLRKNSLPVLQLMYLLRLYHMFGPEEGDGADGGSSQVTNSMLVQCAYQMGLNREPETFDDDWDEKTNSLLRKLWFFIVITDLIQGYQYGNPMAVDPKYFDTRLPFYRKGNENIADVELEKHVISTFAYFNTYYTKLTDILNAVLDIRRQNKIKDITDAMSHFEVFVSNTFGNIQDYMTPFQQDVFSYPFIKVMKCKNFLNMNGFILGMCYQIQLHNENKGNAAMTAFYMKKNISLGTLNLVPHYNELISKNHMNFGESADLILNPTVIQMMHKTSQYNLSLLIKVNGVIHRYKKTPTHVANMNNFEYQDRFRKYCRLSRRIEHVIKYIIASLSRLSARYYYAWRVSKAHGFLMKTVTDNSIFDDNDYSEVIGTFMQISMQDLDEIVMIYDSVLAQVDEAEASRKKCKFATQTSSVEQESPMSDQNVNGSDRTSVTSATDSEFNNLVNNKEVDDLWVQMANEFGKNDMSFLQDLGDGNVKNVLPGLLGLETDYIDFQF